MAGMPMYSIASKLLKGSEARVVLWTGYVKLSQIGSSC